MDSGVFSSWPASLMKTFCFSMVSMMGRTALPARSQMTAKTATSAPRQEPQRGFQGVGKKLIGLRHVQKHGEGPIGEAGLAIAETPFVAYGAFTRHGGKHQLLDLFPADGYDVVPVGGENIPDRR